MRRIPAGFILILILLLGGMWMYRRFMQAPRRPSLWQNVPANYLLIAYTPSFSQTWRAIQHSPLAKYLSQSPHLGDLFRLGQQWDSLLHGVTELSQWLSGHALLIATYAEGTLYLIEAPFLGEIGDWRGEMQRLATRYNWQVETVQVSGGYTLWKLPDGYLVPAGRILAYSRQPTLLIRFLLGENVASLPADRETTIMENENASLLLLTDGKALYHFLPHPLLSAISTLDTIHATIQLTEEELKVVGLTSFSRGVWSHLREASPSLADLCPATSSGVIVVGFARPESTSMSQLSAQYAKLPQGKVEPSQVFSAYFAGDVAFIQGSEPYLLHRLHSAEPIKGFASLRSLSYRGYTIRHLRTEGLHRQMYGEAFASWDPAYSVQIGEWLLFARSPAPLREWIDAFLTRQSLYSRSDFAGLPAGKSVVSGYLDCQNPVWLQSWLPPTGAQRWQQELAPFSQIYLSVEKTDSTYLRIQIRGVWRSQLPLTPTSDTLLRTSVPVLALPSTEDTLRDGPQEEYYPNGVVRRRYMLVDAQMEGEYTEYHPNGTIKVQGFYEQGQKVGKWRYYSSKGELLREEIWGMESETTNSPTVP